MPILALISLLMRNNMNSVLKGVDARTRLVGHNRLELLLFRLDNDQQYGINVFKVREVVSCPKLNSLPNPHPAVIGVVSMRGQTIAVIDLQQAIGFGPAKDPENCAVVIAEYNRRTQGFLVAKIEHIVNLNWEDMQGPPKASGRNHYMTAVTRINEQLVEVIDVEKVLFDVTGVWSMGEGEEVQFASDADKEVEGEKPIEFADVHVLMADDSAIARKQVQRTLDKLGLKSTMACDGREALKILTQWADEDAQELKNLALVISDVEMPEMDGYTLVSKIRADERIKHLTILLHTSLSGVFDSSLLEEVQADGFLSKFNSNELSSKVEGVVHGFLTLQKQKQ